MDNAPVKMRKVIKPAEIDPVVITNVLARQIRIKLKRETERVVVIQIVRLMRRPDQENLIVKEMLIY
jgi:hypothetical protein